MWAKAANKSSSDAENDHLLIDPYAKTFEYTGTISTRDWRPIDTENNAETPYRSTVEPYSSARQGEFYVVFFFAICNAFCIFASPKSIFFNQNLEILADAVKQAVDSLPPHIQQGLTECGKLASRSGLVLCASYFVLRLTGRLPAIGEWAYAITDTSNTQLWPNRHSVV
jgi:hypothetical protein